MIEIVQPVPLDQAMRLVFPLGRAPRNLFRAMTMQLAGEAYGFMKDGRLIMVFGLVPLQPEREGERLFEFWLLIGPEAVPHLWSLVKLARLTWRRVAQDQPVTLRALVRVGHEPGRRLARLVHMQPVGEADGLEIWEWSHGRVR
jgi:hypothetical protein